MAAAEGPAAQTSTTSPAIASNGERGMARRSEEEDVLGMDGFASSERLEADIGARLPLRWLALGHARRRMGCGCNELQAGFIPRSGDEPPGVGGLRPAWHGANRLAKQQHILEPPAPLLWAPHSAGCVFWAACVSLWRMHHACGGVGLAPGKHAWLERRLGCGVWLSCAAGVFGAGVGRGSPHTCAAPAASGAKARHGRAPVVAAGAARKQTNSWPGRQGPPQREHAPRCLAPLAISSPSRFAHVHRTMPARVGGRGRRPGHGNSHIMHMRWWWVKYCLRMLLPLPA